MAATWRVELCELYAWRAESNLLVSFDQFHVGEAVSSLKPCMMAISRDELSYVMRIFVMFGVFEGTITEMRRESDATFWSGRSSSTSQESETAWCTQLKISFSLT